MHSKLAKTNTPINRLTYNEFKVLCKKKTFLVFLKYKK